MINPNLLPFVAAAIVMMLGILHLLYTLHDFGAAPRYFKPQKTELLNDMRATKTALAPNGHDYWQGVLGFHLSHSLGVLLFALLICLSTIYGITWLKPVLIAVGAIYASISYRCWFHIPTISVSVATVILIVDWFLWL